MLPAPRSVRRSSRQEQEQYTQTNKLIGDESQKYLLLLLLLQPTAPADGSTYAPGTTQPVLQHKARTFPLTSRFRQSTL
jgi:hypothetical protein